MQPPTPGAPAAQAPPADAEDFRQPANLELDPERIIATIRTLRDRIQERFPGSGLGGVAGELLAIARVTVARVEWVRRPHLPLRIAAWTLAGFIVLLVVGVVVTVATQLDSGGIPSFTDFLQATEAALSEVVLIGAAILFLVTVEGRVKRRRALGFLRELRALAHIVDMHQLTKDPNLLLQPGPDTPSSPRRHMTRFELARYLDYCSEMLALNSKLAALYAQNFDDSVVLGAVDEVEDLTAGLSRKIWQKIMLIHGDGAGA